MCTLLALVLSTSPSQVQSSWKSPLSFVLQGRNKPCKQQPHGGRHGVLSQTLRLQGKSESLGGHPETSKEPAGQWAHGHTPMKGGRRPQPLSVLTGTDQSPPQATLRGCHSGRSTLHHMLPHFSITTKSVSRYRGQEHCLHPKLQSTKRFIKWYNAWNEKRRYGPRPRTFLPTFPPAPDSRRQPAHRAPFSG